MTTNDIKQLQTETDPDLLLRLFASHWKPRATLERRSIHQEYHAVFEEHSNTGPPGNIANNKELIRVIKDTPLAAFIQCENGAYLRIATPITLGFFKNKGK